MMVLFPAVMDHDAVMSTCVVVGAAGSCCVAEHSGVTISRTAFVADCPYNADLFALTPGLWSPAPLQGVGVVLFSSRHDAKDAIANLTGTQADGRRLDLVLMSEANHISFDSKMVAILGLPWEYTSADARALLDAAAVEEDGAAEGGVSGGEGSCVEKVEVAYREDGKSEVGQPFRQLLPCGAQFLSCGVAGY